MKKNFWILLAALILLFAVACSQENVQEFDLDAFHDINELDLGGKNYKYLGRSPSKTSMLGFAYDGQWGDYALQRYNDVCHNLNCTIEFAGGSYDTVNGIVIAACMTGTPYDMIVNESLYLRDLSRGGYLHGFVQNIDYLDYTDSNKWGSIMILENGCWEDDLFYVLPAKLPNAGFTGIFGALVSNDDLIASNGFDSPREFLEKNEWDWDHFEACLQQFTYSDGDKIIYGMQTPTNYYFDGMFRSNGDTLCEINDKGEFVLGWFTDTGMKAVERAREIRYVSCADCFHPNTSNGGDGRQIFLDYGSVMHVCEGGHVVEHLAYGDMKFSVLPWAYGDDLDSCNYYMFSNSIKGLVGIPKSSEEPDAAAKILNALYEPFGEFTDRSALVDYYKKYVFEHESDAETMIGWLDHMAYAYHREGASELLNNLSASKTLSQSVQEVEKKMNIFLENNLMPTYRGVVAVFGDTATEYLHQRTLLK